MARETTLEETGCGMQTFERNRYFYGKPMTVRDFEAEQRYLIDKGRFLNRHLHGAGVICGLQVTVPAKFDDEKPAVTLTEGAALDCCGNLIVVGESGKVEVAGRVQDGINYLYIEYAECIRQPIMVSSNVASCEEVCCYNRVRETFRLSVSKDSPFEATVSGSVSLTTVSKQDPVVRARVEVLKDGIVRASTSTDAKGEYLLNVASAGTYEVRVTGKNFKASSKQQTLAKRQPLRLDFKVEAAALASFQTPSSTAQASLCQRLTQEYFDAHLRVCTDECNSPKVFLAAFEVKGGVAALAPDETVKYRPIVYSSPMLHALMCEHFATLGDLINDHINDFNNPHRTTAQQVGALRSVNGVGNTGTTTATYVDNITIESDGTIGIENDVEKKKIVLKTAPASTVTSVGKTKHTGTLKSFAREDHTHNLAGDVVNRSHLDADVFNNLLASDGGIHINADAVKRVITIGVGAASDVEQVTSVGARKSVGESDNFAREDHRHDLHINDIAPDDGGHITLAAGKNITITKQGEHSLMFESDDQEGGNVGSGLVIFRDMNAKETRTSQDIPHGVGAGHVAIVLARQTAPHDEALVYMGDLVDMIDNTPAMMANYTKNFASFTITVKDRRNVESPPRPQSYYIRWWAIPASFESETREVVPVNNNRFASDATGGSAPEEAARRTPEQISAEVQFLVMETPGMTAKALVKSLGVTIEELQPQLDALVHDGFISQAGTKYFPV